MDLALFPKYTRQKSTKKRVHIKCFAKNEDRSFTRILLLTQYVFTIKLYLGIYIYLFVKYNFNMFRILDFLQNKNENSNNIF